MLAPQSASYALSELARLTERRDKSARPLLIAGATGRLGQAIGRLCDMRGLPYYMLSRSEMDITDPMMIEVALQQVRPWAVVNATGYTKVDDAERENAACRAANTEGPALLAKACAHYGVSLLTFSSSLVFDGAQAERPYVESDVVAPLNAYGRSKVEMEMRVIKTFPEALIVRTGPLFGLWDDSRFIDDALHALESGETFAAADDVVVSPTYVPDMVHTALDLLIDSEIGIWHIANQGSLTWADFTRQIAIAHGYDPNLIEGRPAESLGWRAPRPRFCALESERAWVMPTLEDALESYKAGAQSQLIKCLV